MLAAVLSQGCPAERSQGLMGPVLCMASFTRREEAMKSTLSLPVTALGSAWCMPRPLCISITAACTCFRSREEISRMLKQVVGHQALPLVSQGLLEYILQCCECIHCRAEGMRRQQATPHNPYYCYHMPAAPSLKQRQGTLVLLLQCSVLLGVQSTARDAIKPAQSYSKG